MFEEFFGFATKPFGKTPDPSFLYESAQHQEALARLEYAVDEKELAVLVGEIGSGKTTLSRALIDRIGDARPVVLLGQPELDWRLDRAAYAPLRQRIGMRYSLGPLALEETLCYIEHRLRIAGASRNPFSRSAMEQIHALSGGIPRLINTLATTALLDAFGDDAEVIEPPRIASAAREHRMDAPGTLS